MHIVERPDPQEHLEFLINAREKWGWALLPLQSIRRNYNGTKVWCSCRRGLRCATVGKHPLINWSDRTKYPDSKKIADLLAAGFTGWGVHLGFSNLICYDIDPRNGGRDTWENFVAAPNPDEHPRTTETGSGGLHIYFNAGDFADPIRGIKGPGGLFSTNIPVGPGVELLSGQHFTVLPFSPHKNGQFYRSINITMALTDWMDPNEPESIL